MILGKSYAHREPTGRTREPIDIRRKSDVVQALENMRSLEVAWVCLRMSGYLHSRDIRMLTQYLETRITVGKKK